MRAQWDRKAAAWDSNLPSSDVFADLLEAILTAVEPLPGDVGLDLGAGTGFLTIPLARTVRRVYAVDASTAMLELLSERAADAGVRVWATRGDLRRFAPPERVDVVVSNYALHHLRGRAKQELLTDAHGWLRPGGRIAVSDLMVPLTLRPGRSGPLVSKVRSIARRGPAGYWRIARNGARWVSGRGEYPAPLEFWLGALRRAGFEDVDGCRIGRESGVAWGRKPKA